MVIPVCRITHGGSGRKTLIASQKIRNVHTVLNALDVEHLLLLDGLFSHVSALRHQLHRSQVQYQLLQDPVTQQHAVNTTPHYEHYHTMNTTSESPNSTTGTAASTDSVLIFLVSL
jgi:hypothetical protein